MDDSQPGGFQLTDREVGRIAEAFEVPRGDVRDDAALALRPLMSEQTLLTSLGDRHHWDDSVAPYYLFWLRGDGGDLPD